MHDFQLGQLGLSDEEYARIEEMLGRAPNKTELAMYSVMWSEHCSYKSSRIHLRNLETSAPHVLVGPGGGAGIIRVDDLAVAFRMESHNHPSFVEPFQGAATGIGGIVRDVLSVGARPIALLDPLRFGPLPVEGRVDEPTAQRNRYLVEGVVSGISSYGNCIGVPTVGGEVKFEDGYSGNPLVNVMCIGIAPLDRIVHARAEGVGNKVILLGSSTGRDGIGGVSVLASATFEEGEEDKRPSVQVGDPFTEKLLIEATLELIDRGLVVGIQDLGGAGLACATSETAANAGSGMRVDLGGVSRREPGMEPFEVLISESQERMLVIVEPEDVEAALGVCREWGLPASVVGEVTAGDRLDVVDEGDLVASVPAASLAEGPTYERPLSKPLWVEELQREDPLALLDGADPRDALLELISSVSISSKRWVWEQYDHQVMLGTVVRPGHDAVVLRLKGARSKIAVSTDGCGRYCTLDPYLGAQHAVAEGARNVSMVGAEPVAITNCLNFGNPEREDVMWQFAEAVRGIGDACRILGTPVTGGNVSFYNETAGRSIDPTPIIGMVGILPEGVRTPPVGFVAGNEVLLLGETFAELGGSELLRTLARKTIGRPPSLDLSKETALSKVVRTAIREGLLESAHDCSEGGLSVALAESCIHGSTGASISLPEGLGLMEWLFSESASRAVVSVAHNNVARVLSIAQEEGLPAARIGETAGSAFEVSLRVGAGSTISVEVAELRELYERSFPEAMGYA